MNISSIEFERLPFTKLFRDYTSGKTDILNFYESDPFDEKELESRILNFTFSGNRKRSVSVLKKYNQQFDPPDVTLESIQRLSDKNALAVITGQQLTIFGGPLFTIYKTITAINFARYAEKKFGVPVVPVFWMADEDHDFDEVSTIQIPGNEETNSFHFDADGQENRPSAFVNFDENFQNLISDIRSELQETDFSQKLWKTLEQFYVPGSTLGSAFGKLMLHLFSEHGLILAGSNFAPIKKEVSKPMQMSILHADEYYATLNNTSKKLKDSGYHSQVHIQKSNLFWLNEDQERIKIQYDDNKWIIDGSDISWSTDELVKNIKKEPEHFSPNVFLRPIIQDQLLPTLSYIAGPGEVAYYAQMKDFYTKFDKKMPLIMPRISATIVETGIDRVLKKLPFKVEEYSKRIEDLESEYIATVDTPDIEQIFNDWKEKTNSILQEKNSVIQEIDPTLTSSAEKVQAVLSSELDKLKGKIYRSVKEQENVQITRIKKIQNNLFPNSNLQEREVAFIYFMNKYGLDIWDKLLNELTSESSKDHKIICL